MKANNLFFLVFVFFAVPPLSAQDIDRNIKRELSAEEIEVVKTGEIIRLCEREEGTQASGNGVGIIKAPIDVVWEVLVDLESYDELMPQTTVSVLLDEGTKDRVIKLGAVGVDEVEKLFKDNNPDFKIVEPENPDRFTVYSYQRNNFPWPASDRWCLLKISHDRSTYTQWWTYLSGNMKNDFGTWQLEPMGEDRTLGWLEIHVDMGIKATGPFMKYAMSLTMPDTYEAFRTGAKQRIAEKEKALQPLKQGGGK